jgi:hypothetical protein
MLEPVMTLRFIFFSLRVGGLALVAAAWTGCDPSSTTRALGPGSQSAAVAPADAAASACPLDWSELGEAAPARLTLARWPSAGTLPDHCPASFDPARLLAGPAACVAPDCVRADLGPGVTAALALDGPGGSGHFWSLGLAVADHSGVRFACTTASTVGWRHLARVADRLAPLPWLADLDGDGAAELIVWQRLPWGHDEPSNGLVPAIYQLENDALVRHDAKGISLARRVATAYRALDGDSDSTGPGACNEAIAGVLDRWGLSSPTR